ncbi:transcriptional regulator GutM [Yersinia enterocolitica]|uniref:transcriptional regulator GutM n=1 Tax=Yersinia enterocolitica TaxID=630 RepID=UPI0005E92349|nr:transcriptional regulator GutM [Yersinia enterocolitica]CNF60573.1 DNA-binding transcriptional activator GutM [Yersinia enterocolitica]
MSPTSALISIVIIAWVLQILLGWWQINRFNRAFDRLCQHGKSVGVGRSGGRFKPRVVMALAFDENMRVSDSTFMRGISVFARPRTLAHLHGLHQQDLIPDVIFPTDTTCQTALSLAIKPKS